MTYNQVLLLKETNDVQYPAYNTERQQQVRTRTAWAEYSIMMASSTYKEVPCVAALVMLVDRVTTCCVAIRWFYVLP